MVRDRTHQALGIFLLDYIQNPGCRLFGYSPLVQLLTTEDMRYLISEGGGIEVIDYMDYLDRTGRTFHNLDQLVRAIGRTRRFFATGNSVKPEPSEYMIMEEASQYRTRIVLEAKKMVVSGKKANERAFHCQKNKDFQKSRTGRLRTKLNSRHTQFGQSKPFIKNHQCRTAKEQPRTNPQRPSTACAVVGRARSSPIYYDSNIVSADATKRAMESCENISITPA